MTNLANQRKRCVLTRRSPAADAPSPSKVPMGWEDSAEALRAAYENKTFNCDVCGEDKPVGEKHHGYPYGLETNWCEACGESGLVRDKQKLKACPFCGGKAALHYNGEANYIECIQCRASTNMQYSLKEDAVPLVVERWNRRVS